MELKQLDSTLTVSGQISASDLDELAAKGVKHLICNRPDGEGSDQPNFSEIASRAEELGMSTHYMPVISGRVSDEDATEFGKIVEAAEGAVHAYCRSGMRCTTLWSLANGTKMPLAEIVNKAKNAGYDMTGVAARIGGSENANDGRSLAKYDVVIVGAGAGGIATASSLLARQHNLNIAIIDPADVHYYQPGWTFVGGGIFRHLFG